MHDERAVPAFWPMWSESNIYILYLIQSTNILIERVLFAYGLSFNTKGTAIHSSDLLLNSEVKEIIVIANYSSPRLESQEKSELEMSDIDDLLLDEDEDEEEEEEGEEGESNVDLLLEDDDDDDDAGEKRRTWLFATLSF